MNTFILLLLVGCSSILVSIYLKTKLNLEFVYILYIIRYNSHMKLTKNVIKINNLIILISSSQPMARMIIK